MTPDDNASVFDLPETDPLRVAHTHSIYHRDEIEASNACGCFYCQKIFAPGEIKDWTDTHKPPPEQTALCPYCGIDSVIGDKSGAEISRDFLHAMNKAWF